MAFYKKILLIFSLITMLASSFNELMAYGWCCGGSTSDDEDESRITHLTRGQPSLNAIFSQDPIILPPTFDSSDSTVSTSISDVEQQPSLHSNASADTTIMTPPQASWADLTLLNASTASTPVFSQEDVDSMDHEDGDSMDHEDVGSDTSSMQSGAHLSYVGDVDSDDPDYISYTFHMR